MSRTLLGVPSAVLVGVLALTSVMAVAQSPAASPGAGAEQSPGAGASPLTAASPAVAAGQSPAASPEAEPPPYGATLRAGTCDQPGEVAAVLADPVVSVSLEDPESGVVELGPRPEQPVRVSESEVPMALADIAEAGHAIVVEDAAAGAVIACGVVGGPSLADERLAVALTAEDGGAQGMALLSALGVEATSVLVLLAIPGERSEEPEQSAEPSPTPDAEGFTEPDPDEPGPDPDPDVDPGEDIDEDVSS